MRLSRRQAPAPLAAFPPHTPLVAQPEFPGHHAVHFYARDDVLLTRLTQYVLEGVHRDETVLVIATEQHRKALRGRVGAQVFRELDAADTLAQFMDGGLAGLPDPQRFDAVVGTLVRDLVAVAPHRAYGEMVALLWAAGNGEATLQLEQLWNGLQAEIDFSLLCAYALTNPLDGAPQDSICDLHTHVLPWVA